jgi:hypothetical protein
MDRLNEKTIKLAFQGGGSHSALPGPVARRPVELLTARRHDRGPRLLPNADVTV